MLGLVLQQERIDDQANRCRAQGRKGWLLMAKKTMKDYEDSPADRRADAKSGAKEGSKRDNAQDRAGLKKANEQSSRKPARR